MSSPIDTIRSRVQKVRGNGRKFTSLCPAHEDKSPSLSVKESEQGDVLLHCFAGCRPQEIVKAMGLEMRDLYAMPIPTPISNGGSAFRTQAERVSFFKQNSVAAVKTLTAEQIEDRLTVIGRKLSEIEEEPITWLWPPFIPLGMYTLIDGEEGIGKTWVVLSIAASVSTGQGLWGVSEEFHIAPGNVLLFASEDSAAQVIKPRLRQMGADMDRVIVVEDPITLGTPKGTVLFENALKHHNPRLVIFDPIFACVGGIDINQDNQIRVITSQLKHYAEEFNCAIVGVRHIGKSKGMGQARNAGLGGIGWRASCRSNLLIGKNPENDRERAIVQTKTNLLSETPYSIGYVIDAQTGFGWIGPSKLTASAMLALQAQETHQDRSEREEAREFLKDYLLGQPRDAKQVMTEARKAGLSEATVKRAKYDLGIKSRKVGLGGWEWALPSNYER